MHSSVHEEKHAAFVRTIVWVQHANVRTPPPSAPTRTLRDRDVYGGQVLQQRARRRERCLVTPVPFTQQQLLGVSPTVAVERR